MTTETFTARVTRVKQGAHGRWPALLAQLGVAPALLNRRNQACPLCGGRDRFQFTDRYGHGNYHCRGCGPGDGFALLQGVLGLSFATALARVDAALDGPAVPLPAPSAAPTAARLRILAQQLWQQAQPLARGDAVDRYLRARGLALATYPATLRCHPALGYFERDANGRAHAVDCLPALLARVEAADDDLVTLHRTYLAHDRKAPVAAPRKVLSGGFTGGAVRLYAAGDTLALAEGIETALAVHLLTGLPVWAVLCAGNFAHVWLPATVRHVAIYADNDADRGFDGQAAAYALAQRLAKPAGAHGRRSVDVVVPPTPGDDWADVWRAQAPPPAPDAPPSAAPQEAR